MSKPINKTLIGGFVVGAMALIVAGVLIFGSGRFVKETHTFVLYFEGSVTGLNVGSPVVWRGVEIGTVKDILLRFDPDDMSMRIPVIIEIDLDRIEIIGSPPHEQVPDRYIDLLVARGLRARLQMQNLVTGQLMVDLDCHPGKPIKLVSGDIEYPEIPTIPSPLEELSKRIEEVPIEEIFRKLLSAVEGIEEMVNSPEVKGLVGSLNQAVEDVGRLAQTIDDQVTPLASNIEGTLKDTRKLVRNVDAQVTPLVSGIDEALREARAALEQGRKTLAVAEDVLAEDSPLLYELEHTLKELSEASRSIRLLVEYLKRHPEALLKGKGTSGGK